jgi:magnesium transporter
MHFSDSQNVNTWRTGKSYQPPGSITHAESSHKLPPTIITHFKFREFNYTEQIITPEEVVPNSFEPEFVHWINVDGLHQTKLIEEIGNNFHLHPLTIEDIVSPDQRTKFEEYDNYSVIVLKMLYREEELRTEQLCIVLTQFGVITFQEIKGGDPFEAIRERIRQGKGRVRKMGADYLAYALMDAVVDSYFIMLGEFGDRLDVIDAELTDDPDEETIRKLRKIKRELLFMRKVLLPMRETITVMQRDENNLIKPEIAVFVRDLQDHVIRVIETIENYRDIVGEMIDTYMSMLSNRMNQIMKVLTIISTIFIPLTFIAGIYGMNFDYMPELHEHIGYPLVLAFMALTAISLLWYFRKKRWM